ncbi:carbohydrate ABC transporter permease [Qingshengfaniella alkalisoli]|uniref:sn-glycerol-3-phosphate transport system permease protein UgpE n=1 Tax=Qingshengfaniella alkalisoli TaxID=2599296 RepID=A0A5B8J2P4_9RHOB|nr:carbohydrate ABC transporter permease [Qingshengfaniella alkalisoli]QDY71038.1 carbohydrate ABC transporter permease [Qingshengfaniella alkalisoli]
MSIAGQTNRKRYLVTAICLFVVALMVFPLIVSLFASVKPAAEAQAVPPSYLPTSLSLESYLNFANYQAGLGVYLTNSLVVAFLTIFFCLLLAVPAGYGLARFPIPGKEFLFLLLLASLMIPYQALLTPLLLVFNKLGLQQTQVGLALIHTALQMPFSVYLMRTSFEAVPKDLEEAAMIDGCNSMEALFRIFLPAVVPGMTTVALFAFIMSWNEFIAALIFMNSESKFTIPVMLVASRTGSYGAIDWGMLQAGVIISILPCALLYVFLQKYYVSGFLNGAVK